jgi:hypothetical protein
VVEKDKIALTSELPTPSLQLFAKLAPGFQRTGTLLVELVPLFLEMLDLLV